MSTVEARLKEAEELLQEVGEAEPNRRLVCQTHGICQGGNRNCEDKWVTVGYDVDEKLMERVRTFLPTKTAEEER